MGTGLSHRRSRLIPDLGIIAEGRAQAFPIIEDLYELKDIPFRVVTDCIVPMIEELALICC